jgi:hypothetical protein
MFYFFKTCGPYGPLLALLSLLVLGYAAFAVRLLTSPRAQSAPGSKRVVNGVLFWGSFAAVLGLMGQITAIYISFNIILNAEVVNPKLVAQGFAESFSPTIFGLAVGLVSALIWGSLRVWLGRVQNRTA